MFKNNKKNREEFRQRSKKRFNFLKFNRKKKELNFNEALSFKREKTPLKK